MARNSRRKEKHTITKKRNAWNTAKDLEIDSNDDNEFSRKLSRVLDYFAVNEDLIQFRRKVNIHVEHEQTLILKSIGYNRRLYIFGSQVEGTTTNGMMSDLDILQRFDTFRLFLDSENPPSQSHDQQVVIKVSTNGCASQYCVLTIIDPSTLAIRLQQLDLFRDPVDFVDFFRCVWTQTNGMIPHKVMFLLRNHPPAILKQAKRHGPAESLWRIDNVYACYCKSLPKQCKFVFERPRPGHWPSEKMLSKAKKCGVFIVPMGPPRSTNICTYDNFDYQWRISTNLTERLFMFSLDTVHLKAYVLTKMIRKELFIPIYRDRLSTFHFKTAFFFAVETIRPDVWRKDNLINCVKYILVILRRFLTRRNCPHFTIENVNLFDGKFERHEFPKLVDTFTSVINSLRTKIEHIQMDHIGMFLNDCNAKQNERSKYHTNVSALYKTVCNVFQGVIHTTKGFESSVLSVNMRIGVFMHESIHLETYHRAPLDEYRKYDYALHNYMSGHASFGASAYLEQTTEGQKNTQYCINKAKQIFKQSLKHDIIGTYMRYASFLFCNREYDEACNYFEFLEKQIEEDKKSNLIYQLFVSPSESLALQIAKLSWEQSSKQKKSFVLIFETEEAMCIPEFLRCEMYQFRFGTGMCVQIEPYLYYLQYRTYRLLNQEHKQSEALLKLTIFTKIIKPTQFNSHFDLSLKMLMHCLELEQKKESV
ncbi:hypothetical protein DPMN_158160 [Dreissena polymorpha]|uniref:Mab-21-like HhH/H2TH-like domain-containing protein n=1 Tax=Dreissena polymorpha TaxID=45954 RepID=A0A9D4ELX9_DREPO|nr:hypothetical protein DPMN_158160 [Dreissena polymorpha]